MFKFILGSFSAFLIFSDLVSTYICTATMVVSLYHTDILLLSKWPSRASKPLGLFFFGGGVKKILFQKHEKWMKIWASWSYELHIEYFSCLILWVQFKVILCTLQNLISDVKIFKRLLLTQFSSNFNPTFSMFREHVIGENIVNTVFAFSDDLPNFKST